MNRIALFLCKILLKKEENTMVAVYVSLIVKGKKTFAQVPERIKPQVKQMLIDLDLAELAEEGK